MQRTKFIFGGLLILAAVFTPIRRSIEGIVDRTFKPAPADRAADERSLPSPRMWDDPEHAAAVERIVRRVIHEDEMAGRPNDIVT